MFIFVLKLTITWYQVYTLVLVLKKLCLTMNLGGESQLYNVFMSPATAWLSDSTATLLQLGFLLVCY